MSRDEATQQRQLDIVLNLNRLTKQGRLSWKRDSQPSQVEGPGAQDTYVADWKGHRVIVEAVQNLRSSPEIRWGTPSDGTYRLRVRPRQSGEDNIVIPPMGAIDDLVDTIQRTNDYADRSSGDIEALESFNRLLEEDL